MKKTIDQCKAFALEIANYYPEILPAIDVIAETSKISEGSFKVTEIGRSRQGNVIQLMSQNFSGNSNALLYGFPDPGEAVGGTGLLCLMRALKANHPFLQSLDINWNFIPCLNYDDQPNAGKTLDIVMKTGQQEVDWLVPDPRPETTALLNIAKELKPKFVFPLHDEWHCREEIPCYIPVSRPLDIEICQGLRFLLQSFGLKISNEMHDLEMGAGFLNMASVGDIKNSTFFEFGKYGLVFICEVPDIKDKPDSQIIAAQLAGGLYVAANAV